MGLFDHLFKSKSPPSEESSVETGAQRSEDAARGATHRADPSAFLHPKSFVPRGVSALSPLAKSGAASGVRKLGAPAAPATPDAIVLTLGDVLSRIPTHYLRNGQHDPKRELRFSINDLSSDIARGRAAVPLSKIAQLMPDIFVGKISRDEDTEVRLPLQKLVEQIGLLRARPASPASERITPPASPPAIVEMSRPQPDSEIKLEPVPQKAQTLEPTVETLRGLVAPTESIFELKPAALVAAPVTVVPEPAPASKPLAEEPAPAPFADPEMPLADTPAAKEPDVLAPSETPTAIEPAADEVEMTTATPASAESVSEKPAKADAELEVIAPAPVPAADLPPLPLEKSEQPLAQALPPMTGEPLVPSTERALGATVPAERVTGQSAQPAPIAKEVAEQNRVSTLPVEKVAAGAAIPALPLKEVAAHGVPTAKPAKQNIPPAITADELTEQIPLPPLPEEEVGAHSLPSAAPSREASAESATPATPPEEIAASLKPAERAAALDWSENFDVGDERIQLSLAAILRECPKEIIVGELPTVPDNIRITLPFAPIDRQLVMGHVEVSAVRFVAALPLSYQKYFSGRIGVKVPIPLEEVFQNLPSPATDAVTPSGPPAQILAPVAGVSLLSRPNFTEAPPFIAPNGIDFPKPTAMRGEKPETVIISEDTPAAEAIASGSSPVEIPPTPQSSPLDLPMFHQFAPPPPVIVPEAIEPLADNLVASESPLEERISDGPVGEVFEFGDEAAAPTEQGVEAAPLSDDRQRETPGSEAPAPMENTETLQTAPPMDVAALHSDADQLEIPPADAEAIPPSSEVPAMPLWETENAPSGEELLASFPLASAAETTVPGAELPAALPLERELLPKSVVPNPAGELLPFSSPSALHVDASPLIAEPLATSRSPENELPEQKTTVETPKFADEPESQKGENGESQPKIAAEEPKDAKPVVQGNSADVFAAATLTIQPPQMFRPFIVLPPPIFAFTPTPTTDTEAEQKLQSADAETIASNITDHSESGVFVFPVEKAESNEPTVELVEDVHSENAPAEATDEAPPATLPSIISIDFSQALEPTDEPLLAEAADIPPPPLADPIEPAPPTETPADESTSIAPPLISIPEIAIVPPEESDSAAASTGPTPTDSPTEPPPREIDLTLDGKSTDGPSKVAPDGEPEPVVVEPPPDVEDEAPSATAEPPPIIQAAPEVEPLLKIPQVMAEFVHTEVVPPPALPLRRFDQENLKALFMTDENLDLAKISWLAAQLPGVHACVIATRDQACTGGTLPEGFDLAALLGLAPRVGEAAGRMPIGTLKHFTLYGEQYSVSFFERNGLSLCAVHRPRSFVPGVREKLVAIADELSLV